MRVVNLATSEALLTAATTVAAGAAVGGISGVKTFQASGTTTASTGAATILVQGKTLESSSWDTLGTITLTLATTVSSDSFTSDDRYSLLRGNVTAISGTGASINLVMGY